MTKNLSTPAIRFKGFTDTWEQRKLGDIFKYEQPQAYIVESTEYDDRFQIPVLTAGQSFVLGYTDEDFGIKNASPRNPVVIFDDFTTSSHYVDFPFKIKSSAMKLLSLVNEKDDILCAYNVLQNIGYEPVSHERHWISTFAKFNVYMPQNSAEQKCIGNYFANLDNLITLHQRKYDKLTNVKKSMLEKMFPKNGSNVPEIRFKGFTEAWEQRELWELTIWDKKFNEVEAEKQPKIIKYPYVLADVFSKIEDASGDVRLLSTGNYIGYTTDEKAGKNLCVGEVVAIPWGGVPNIKYYKGKFVTADNRIATSNDTETLGNRFLSLYLEHSLAFLQSIYRGASIKHPSMNDVLSMQISIPHIQEQREIETWFANLDNLITLHQRELEKLKNLKKACLEKMFV